MYTYIYVYNYYYIIYDILSLYFTHPLWLYFCASSVCHDVPVKCSGCWCERWPVLGFFSHQTCPAPRPVRTSRTPTWSELRRSSNILPSCRLTCCRCCSTRTRASLWVATAPRTSPVGKTENNKQAPHLSASATRRCFQSPTTWCSTTCTPCPSRWRHRPQQLHAFILTWWVTGVDGIADVYPSGWMVSEPNS